MHLKLGEVSNIIVSSPEVAQQIMKTHDLNFYDRPEFLFARIISYNVTNISLSPYGDYWRQLRKICTTELLTAKRVQSFRSIREEEVSELVKAISSSEGSIVNLSEKISSTTYGIARAAFGKKSRHQQELLRKQCKARLEKLHRETDRMMQDIIDDHKNRKSNHCEASEDLVDLLLNFEYPLTDDIIKAVIQDMFVGDGETSSTIVEWAMAEMIKSPKVMEAAQDEVRRVYASNGYVDESELQQLTYSKCVIKETLRLHPSLPLLVPRESRERCQINGYEIPAKSKVIINAWAIGRDPMYWIDAETFKPERILSSSIDYRGSNFELMPFGVGRRMCPGIAFATQNMELPLAQLLYHFDWKLPNGMKHEELNMTESFGFAIRRQNGLCLIPLTHQP